MSRTDCQLGRLAAVLPMGGLLACSASPPAPARPAAAPAAAATAAPAAVSTPAPLERVVISTSDPGIVFSPLYVGVAKGFFREEGLAPDVQIVTPNVSLAALANNHDVDYQ